LIEQVCQGVTIIAQHPILRIGCCAIHIRNYLDLILCEVMEFVVLFVCSVVMRRLYPYGSQQGDVTLDWGTTTLSCDWAGKSCSSGFIGTPRMKIFSSEFTDIKVSRMQILY